MRQWDPCEEVDGMLMFQVLGGYCFQFLWRVSIRSAKTFGTDTLRVFFRAYVFCTPLYRDKFIIDDVCLGGQFSGP